MAPTIYETPELSANDLAVLDLIYGLQKSSAPYIHTPRRWFGTLRRELRARSVQGSNSIEGYHASVDDVAAVLDGEDPSPSTSLEVRQAIKGYTLAMDFVLQQVGAGLRPEEPTSVPLLDLSRLQALHFMLMRPSVHKNPGRWRRGDVTVEDAERRVVYTAPERDLVEPLLIVLCDEIAAPSAPKLVAAAMAHLNLTLIHPFSDGNGRMARIIQSLVLAADTPSPDVPDTDVSSPDALNPGTPSTLGAAPHRADGNRIQINPDFGNIEEYLGSHQADYYSTLQAVAKGTWSPHRSARPWVEFSLTAYYHQAQSILLRVAQTEALWDRCEQLIDAHDLPRRTSICLNDSARGWRLTRRLYMARTSEEDRVSEGQASRDLAALVKAGLLKTSGEKRGRTYHPSDTLRQVWQQVCQEHRSQEPVSPYDLVMSS